MGIEACTTKTVPDKLVSSMTKMTRVTNGERHSASVYLLVIYWGECSSQELIQEYPNHCNYPCTKALYYLPVK